MKNGNTTRNRHWRSEMPLSLRLLERRQESASGVTLLFSRPDRAGAEAYEDASERFRLDSFRPGQFVMVWLPHVDEKPFTVSYLDEERFGLTVLRRGPFTRALHALSPGAWVGFRGPYGNGFEIRPEGVVVGGGVGMATMALLIERLDRPIVLQGARTEAELLYMDRFDDMSVWTDDGSHGSHGMVTDGLAEVLESRRPGIVYTCGPEPMMVKVAEMCRQRGVDCQVSLERYMKCGFGVCGQCTCNGLQVCRDGPVFSLGALERMSEFGDSARLKTGGKISIIEYLRSPGAGGDA